MRDFNSFLNLLASRFNKLLAANEVPGESPTRYFENNQPQFKANLDGLSGL